jgi:hypothetical protein
MGTHHEVPTLHDRGHPGKRDLVFRKTCVTFETFVGDTGLVAMYDTGCMRVFRLHALTSASNQNSSKLRDFCDAVCNVSHPPQKHSQTLHADLAFFTLNVASTAALVKSPCQLQRRRTRIGSIAPGTR